MKKLMLLMVFLVFICNVLFAQFVVDSTKTMNSETFLALRDATEQDIYTDEVMRFYWCKLIGIDPPPDGEDGEGDFRGERANYHPINMASHYAKEALWGAIGHETDEHAYPDQTPDQILELARRYLLDQDFQPDYLDLDSLWVEIDDNLSPLTIGDVLFGVAFIVDNLWYYVDDSTRIELYNKLDNIAWGINEAILWDTWGGMAFFNPEYPEQYAGLDSIGFSIGMNNKRIHLDGALGYAGCVLGNEEYIETVENDLFSWNNTRLWWVDGLIDFMSGTDGIYSEGVFYSEIVSILNSFFTAQKRLYGVNNFERPEMKALYTESLHLLTPEFHFVTFDDAFLGHVLDNNGNTNVLSFSEVISYYNQGNPTAEEKAEIEWIVCGYFQEYSEYPKYWQARTRLYTYNSDCNGAFTTMPSVPQSIAQGSYDGNSEFTIMRPEINDLNEFKNSTYLFVNHENSAPYSSHEHSDQSSFVLYYKGKQLLIDPGYLPARKSYFLAKEWLASPYAHNLIMVNPQCNNDYENVEDELFYDYTNIRNSLYNWNDSTGTDPNYYNFNYYSFEPVGRCYYPYPDFPSSQYSVGLPDSPLIPKNPAFRNYLIDNDNVQHLQVEIEYDHPQAGETYSNYNGNPNDIINIKRNFYGLNFNEGNEYFIIYDNLESSDQSNSNEFMNQLHFGLFRPGIMEDQITDINDINSSNGIFEYTMYDNSTNLFGAMGALSGNSNRTLRDSLPQGLYVGKNWGINEDDPLPPAWEHKCLRINTETAGDEKFLTLLIPSEDSDNPIEEISQEGDTYAVKFSLDTDYNIYTAVSDAGSVYLDYGNTRFVTNTSFFLVEANNIFTDVKKIILNSDKYLEVRDMSGTDFTDVVVFDSDYDSEEILAEWTENDELEITTVMRFEGNSIPMPVPNPKFKILRCSVFPENLISKTYYYCTGDLPQHQRGTIEDNIETLAYDSLYFYINYEYSDLVAENLLTEELTIYKGTFDNIEISGISKFGLGEIEFRNEITVPVGVELKFVSGSHPQMAEDTKFIVNGQVTAIGDSLNIIEFDKKLTANWKGFYIYSGGESDFQYCKFTEAERPIQCFGSINLENSEVNNCEYGLYLVSPDHYTMSSNEISECVIGVFIGNYSYPYTHSYFEGNIIFNCQFGLFLYNTNALIDSNMIFSNTSNGMYISRRSHPIIQSSFVGNTRNGDIDNPEIYLIGDSYPVLDCQYNDIIIESGGRSISIYNANGEENRYYCRENFWGEGISITEISQSFYPEEWEVIFLPISDSSNTGFNPPTGGGRLFDEGLQAEKEGDLVTAKDKYLLSIEQNPDYIEALWSASRLINCVDPDIGFGFYEAQQLYEGIMEDSLNVDLYELSKQSAVNCDRKMENFQDAIFKYEIMFEDSLSFIDSIFTQLDIVYTYMEAEAAGGRASGICFLSEKHAVRNLEHAREMEDELLSLLMQETGDVGIYSPIIEKVKLHGNYPNPFNPSTTISFSIPKDSKVEITIYNIRGQKVRTVLEDNLEKGRYNIIWNGKDSNGKSVASGVYFYMLKINGKARAVRKCLMLK